MAHLLNPFALVVSEVDSKEGTNLEEQLEAIAKQLDQLMTKERVFKNPDLSLYSLSKQLGVKPYLTSKCLNLIFEKKFN